VWVSPVGGATFSRWVSRLASHTPGWVGVGAAGAGGAEISPNGSRSPPALLELVVPPWVFSASAACLEASVAGRFTLGEASALAACRSCWLGCTSFAIACCRHGVGL
jgi:hypothetical protein